MHNSYPSVYIIVHNSLKHFAQYKSQAFFPLITLTRDVQLLMQITTILSFCVCPLGFQRLTLSHINKK